MSWWKVTFKLILDRMRIIIILTPIIFAMSANAKNFDSQISKLTDIQREVTQNDATERPFNNEYWDNKEEGIYVDVVSGEVLFSSKDKYDSGSGWPSFVKPIDADNIATDADHKIGYERTEIRSKTADSHLGHVFDDGPEDRGGKRYCVNSAAMRFIAKDDLEKEGYGEYAKEFH